MKVDRIQRIQEIGVFRDFSWPGTLPDFSRFNLIYGWNGSGKTTLSRLFNHLSTREAFEGDVEFRVDQLGVSNANIGTAPLPSVRVFNRRTVDASVFEVTGQQFSPIFFFGEDSVEKQKRVETLRAELEKNNSELSKRQSRHATAQNTYEAFCTERARLIRELLASPGSAYINYDKRDFKAKAQGLTADTVTERTLSEDDKRELKGIKDAKPKDKVDPIKIAYPDITGLTNEVMRLLGRSVASQVLEELATDREVASWVQSGIPLHTGTRTSQHCHFCGNEIKAERLAHLNAHFNDEFKTFQSQIAASLITVDAAIATLNDVSLPDKSVLYDHLAGDYKTAHSSFLAARANVIMYLEALKRALNAKKEAPFEKLDLLSFMGPLKEPPERMSTAGVIFSAIAAGAAALGSLAGKDAVVRMNGQIALHNAHTENFNAEIANARRELEMGYVAEAFPEYQKKRKAIETTRAAVEQTTAAVREATQTISDLERSIRQHQRPAEELTLEVKAYLGHSELAFATHDTGYTVTRQGNPATNLSEGERTAIALLYFLKSLRDTSFNMSSGVVVIDDPVSSLDSNSIYSAFGFIKDRTRDAGQLFVLTHNFAFFRQVKNWFHHIPGQGKKDITQRPARFYMLHTRTRDGQRNATLGSLDPLLEEFESEYHYLFKCIHVEATREEQQHSLAENYSMPNIARRALEAFLAFRLPGNSGELFRKMDLIAFDPAKKARILRFLHTHSHYGEISEPEHDMSILSEAQAVLRDVLSLIETTDPEHYKAMVALVSLNPAAAEDG